MDRYRKRTEAQLRIIKSQSGSDYTYDFSLWCGRERPVFGQRSVEAQQYKNRKAAIEAIKDHIADFRRKLVSSLQAANRDYQKAIGDWLQDIPRMIKKEFLPPKDSQFAQKMIRLEQRAKSGEQVVLTITTNEYLIPWWLTHSYTSDELNQIWSALFVIGFMPAHITLDPHKTKPISKPRIALISRPSSDLRNARRITDKLIMKNLAHQVEIHNGEKNEPEIELGRFGLLREEIEKTLSENQVLFYYGHFELNEKFPEQSYLEALDEFAAGRMEHDVEPEKITLKSVEKLIKGKVLFLDACRSIGLPFLADKPFPQHNEILPDFYLINKAICIGTIYPIFDDAAVDYMTSFIQFLLDGYTLGEAMKKAREELDRVGYSPFNWASYILVGDPNLKLITKQGDK